MNTYYIPVHFYERGPEDDAVVMLVTKREYGACELGGLLRAEKGKLNISDYPSKEDMADAILDSLAKRTGGVWSYCSTVPALVIGDDDGSGDAEAGMRAVDAAGLAALLIKLEAGECLTFSTSYNEETGEARDTYGVTLINGFDSYVLLINCLGGGSPCAIDITCYQTDLNRIREDLAEYFKCIEPAPRHVFIDVGEIENIEKRDQPCQ